MYKTIVIIQQMFLFYHLFYWNIEIEKNYYYYNYARKSISPTSDNLCPQATPWTVEVV